ncbi:hypothetical protein [Streptomyces parvus]|uniref:hypothetical protein n=1 Tax=Streptomyces parvus TaxID=66428 RepID=UPI003D71734E
MVFIEAFVTGVLASAAGCRLGAAGMSRLAAWMADVGIAPAWFRIGEQTRPLHTAFWTGLFVALSAALPTAPPRARVRRRVEVLAQISEPSAFSGPHFNSAARTGEDAAAGTDTSPRHGGSSMRPSDDRLPGIHGVFTDGRR